MLHLVQRTWEIRTWRPSSGHKNSVVRSSCCHKNKKPKRRHTLRCDMRIPEHICSEGPSWLHRLNKAGLKASGACCPSQERDCPSVAHMAPEQPFRPGCELTGVVFIYDQSVWFFLAGLSLTRCFICLVSVRTRRSHLARGTIRKAARESMTAP